MPNDEAGGALSVGHHLGWRLLVPEVVLSTVVLLQRASNSPGSHLADLLELLRGMGHIRGAFARLQNVVSTDLHLAMKLAESADITLWLLDRVV